MPPRKGHRPSRSIHTAESTGLLAIVLLMILLALVRYWRFVHWSWR